MDKVKDEGQHIRVLAHSHTDGTKINRPFEVVVLQPHVGVFGIPFSHDGVPQFSGFLHVLTVKGLREKI